MNFALFSIVIIGFLACLAISIYWSLRASTQDVDAKSRADEMIRNSQLHEIETNLAAGNINENDAKAMRNEIERAYKRASRHQNDDLVNSGPIWVIWSLCGLLAFASFLAYKQMGVAGMPDMPFAQQEELRRPPQARAEEMLASQGALAELPAIDAQTKGLIEQLEEVLAKNPKDPRGWDFLARAQYSVGNFKAAYEAKAQYNELIGSEKTAEDFAFFAESMILSVNGYISPEAESALRSALQIDPSNQVGRYYAGLTMIQNDEIENGRLILQKLRNDLDDDPDWQAEIDARLAASEPEKGPSADDIEAAEAMSAQERQEMIGTMVDGLKARLADSGGTPEEWARLINALRVLERFDEADAILGEARQKFPDDPNIQAIK